MVRRKKKAFAGFANFKECVRKLASQANVDDEEALCAWLERMHKEGKLQKAARVIFDVDSEFVSYVDGPMVVRSKMMIKKKGSGKKTVCRKYAKILRATPGIKSKAKAMKKHGIVYAAALIPDEVDGGGEIIPGFESRKTAYKFMEDYRQMDADHSFIPGAGTVLESWVPHEETTWTFDDGTKETYPADTWFLGSRPSPEVKALIDSGEFNGYSIGGDWPAIDLESMRQVKSMKPWKKWKAGCRKKAKKFVKDPEQFCGKLWKALPKAMKKERNFGKALSTLTKKMRKDCPSCRRMVKSLKKNGFDDASANEVLEGYLGTFFMGYDPDSFLEELTTVREDTNMSLTKKEKKQIRKMIAEANAPVVGATKKLIKSIQTSNKASDKRTNAMIKALTKNQKAVTDNQKILNKSIKKLVKKQKDEDDEEDEEEEDEDLEEEDDDEEDDEDDEEEDEDDDDDEEDEDEDLDDDDDTDELDLDDLDLDLDAGLDTKQGDDDEEDEDEDDEKQDDDEEDEEEEEDEKKKSSKKKGSKKKGKKSSKKSGKKKDKKVKRKSSVEKKKKDNSGGDINTYARSVKRNAKVNVQTMGGRSN